MQLLRRLFSFWANKYFEPLQVCWRILKVLSPRLRLSALTTLGIMIVVGVTEYISILVLAFFAMTISDTDGTRNSGVYKWIMSQFPSIGEYLAGDGNLILSVCALAVLAIISKNILWVISNWKMNYFAGETSAWIGCEAMRLYLAMPYLWHLSSEGMDAFTKISWRMQLAVFMMHNLVILSSVVTLALLFIGLLMVSPIVTLFVAGAMALVSYGLCYVLNRRVAIAGNNVAMYSAEETRITMNSIKGIREVIIYNQQPVFLQALKDAISKLLPQNTFIGIASALPSYILEASGMLLVFCAAIYMIRIQCASAGEIIVTMSLLLLTAWRILPSINRIVGGIVAARGCQGMATACLDFFISLKEKSKNVITHDDQTNEAMSAMRSSLELRNVCFRYPSAQADCLRGVNLVVPKGACVGILGLSGSGKSTLLNILSGLTEPSSGEIWMDGKRLSRSEMLAFRRKVGYVSQKPYLLAGTLAENIAFSQWRMPYDAEKIRNACRQSAVDFVGADCQNIEYAVGEDGQGLSGGQAQRISIARALYANPSILLFDEATSALDHVNEDIILRTVQELRHETTCVIVTHRLNTLAACDHIYWLQNGVMVAQGAPEAIIQRYLQDVGDADQQSGLR